MAAFKPLGNYPALSKYISETLWRPISLPEPFRGATSLDVFQASIDNGRLFLPARYQESYVDVLEAALRQAETTLSSPSTRSRSRRSAIIAQLESVFSVLASPIAQISSTAHKQELKALLATTSNIYRRLVDDIELSGLDSFKSLSRDLDPLAYFGSNSSGPFTLVASKELPVTLISKPSSHLNLVAFWLTDGHEVAGHCIFNSVKGLNPQAKVKVEEAIKRAVAARRIKGTSSVYRLPSKNGLVYDNKRQVSFEQLLIEMFGAWSAEILADAAGVLNFGPLFVDCGMLTLAHSRAGGGINLTGEYDARAGFREHPVDLIRVLLTIEMVRKLSLKDREVYASALHQRLLQTIGGALPSSVAWLKPSGGTLVEVPLDHLRSALPVVADALFNAQLSALGGKSLAQTITWTETDESLTREVSAQLTAGDTNIGEEVEARHVVAASLLSVEKASLSTGFNKAADRIHLSAVEALASIYDSQCLLCSVPSRKAKDKSETSATALSDLLRLVKHLKGR